jgi:hypothetical protein
MFAVYLTVDFIQLYIDIMQRLLNTHSFTLSSHLKRTFITSRIWLLASLTLLLTGLAGPAAAADTDTEFYKDYVVLNNNYYYTKTNNTYGIRFQGSHITGPVADGSFDRGTGQLLIGGEANTTIAYDRGDDVYTPQMYYRVYLEGTSQATLSKLPFTSLTLNYQSSNNDGYSNSKKWSNTTNNSNLLAATSGPGRYVLEVYYYAFATYNNSGGKGSFQIYDYITPSVNYTATFNVSGSVPLSWNGSANDGNWFTDTNWTPRGLPNSTTDVTIPYNANAGDLGYPTISYGTAQVRTLSIEGNNTDPNASTIGARNFLSDGELQVFGDFRDPNGGFAQGGGVFTLAGRTQTFDGASFRDVHIQGGGTKTLTTRMSISNRLSFVNSSGGGIIATSTKNSTVFNVDLGVSAQVEGESEASYVLGYLRTPFRYVTRGVLNTFGNIGVDLTANAGEPGTTLVTRLTGTAYTGAGTKNASVKRSFTFTPSNSNDLNFTLNFHYLNGELNDNAVNQLVLERSLTGAAPFENLGRASSDPTAKTLTTTSIAGTLAATFTLAQDAPLPVTLVSFAATPTSQGAALLRWVTAKELNNKGFGIERTLGTTDTWQQVGYVATTNTPNGKSYEYTDKSLITAPASTQAYYRLRQEDLDGKVTYSPVAVVGRQAAVASTNLILSPVPVDGPNLSVSFAEAGQAGQDVTIINTQGQRMLHFTTQNSAEGTLSLPVSNLAAGVYIVRIQTPGQAVRHARFVKL